MAKGPAMNRSSTISGKRTSYVLVTALAAVLVLSACTRANAPATSTSVGRSGASVPQLGAPSAGDGSLAGGAASPAVPNSTGKSATAPTVRTLIVVNKTVRLESADVDASIAKIRDLVARDGADIASMQVSTATDQPVYPVPLGSDANSADQSVPLRAFVIVRVPTAKYGSFVADVAKLGRVLFQSESADDVTQQHIDMQARLGNLQAEQARLRQLFSRAKNVRDMLAIEQELTRVRGDIESLQAQISYLEKQAAMATVTIELSEPKPIVGPSGTDWGVATALRDSIHAFVDTMNGLIVILGPFLALVAFVGLPVLLVVWLIRRALRRRRNAAADAVRPVVPTPPTDPGRSS